MDKEHGNWEILLEHYGENNNSKRYKHPMETDNKSLIYRVSLYTNPNKDLSKDLYKLG